MRWIECITGPNNTGAAQVAPLKYLFLKPHKKHVSFSSFESTDDNGMLDMAAGSLSSISSQLIANL